MEKYIIKSDEFEYSFTFIEDLKPVEKQINLLKEQLKEYKGRELVKSLLNDDSIDKNKPENILFCKFRLNSKNINKSGVYLWVVNNKIIYIGEARNLEKRFNNGYGNISPRNIFKGGQSTNCKMNRVAMKYFQNASTVKIYFYETAEYKKVEKQLLEYFKEIQKWEELYNSKL